MRNWLLKRFAQAIITVWAVITITFALTRFLPGGPVDFMKARLIRQGQTVDEDRLNRLAEVYTNINPDQPLLQAYVDYVGRLVQGNMGQSIYNQEPVSTILADAVPWTVFLMSMSVTLMFAIGVIFGATMAYAEGSRFDSVLSTISTVTMAVPYYIFAVLFLYYFGFIKGWFPTGGKHASGVPPGLRIEFFRSAIWHAILPAAAIVIPGIGGPALQMRGNSIQVLGKDYLRVARLRGLPGRTIATRYVGRNAILPMYTNFLIFLGIYFGGAVILEEIFTYTGVGFYMFQAINTRDYPLMMGSFIVLTTAVVLAILIADLTYGKLDPRISAGGERESY
jgi:peptide/nickel transport system permease protein